MFLKKVERQVIFKFIKSLVFNKVGTTLQFHIYLGTLSIIYHSIKTQQSYSHESKLYDSGEPIQHSLTLFSQYLFLFSSFP